VNITPRRYSELEVEPEVEPTPKFGDFNGACLNVGSENGELNLDRNGVDIYTGKRYQLSEEQKLKFVEVDKQSKRIDMARVLYQSKYDINAPRTKRKYDYEGLVVTGAYCLWLGARKAEKSLFALRKSMHDACGKNWFNHKNMVGPVKVLYFDTENDKAEVDERYREIITEFTESEQALIRKNLSVVLGKELKRRNIDIEFDSKDLWEYFQDTSKDVRVVYLDCWYQLQSIKAADNQAQKLALEMFEKYFPKTTLFLLHHTGRESEDSLLRKSPAWLRVLGAERWSNKSSGGNVLTKKAELIICQERYVERDAEGIENDWFIDFQAYSRSSPSSILFSFEPVFFGEEVNGAAPEYKYRRKMVSKLSSLAAKAAKKLQGKGPWKSRYDLTKEIGMYGGKQYRAVDELIVKGFIVPDGDEFYLNEIGFNEAIDLSAENVVAVKTAAALLEDLLLRPDGTSNSGVLYDIVKARAEVEGINLGSLRRARSRMKVETETRDGKPYWLMPKRKQS
jgi:AAA domain-containing protein